MYMKEGPLLATGLAVAMLSLVKILSIDLWGFDFSFDLAPLACKK